MSGAEGRATPGRATPCGAGCPTQARAADSTPAAVDFSSGGMLTDPIVMTQIVTVDFPEFSDAV